MRKKHKRKPVKFSRVLVPASRPHSTKKGDRGYSRKQVKREEQEHLGEVRRPRGRKPT